ncbi:MAG: inositol monophosphatase [Propionibacteriaceae bacterium]|nr:inositol monophosphatase [Propionibacteriaceae bacterium]
MLTRDILNLIVRVTDEVIRPRFGALADDQVFLKGPGDYVTVADREAEAALAEALSAAHRGAVVVGEEATAADPTLRDGILGHDHCFVVDPIDGTGNFVRSNPDHAVMVGELRRGVATRGWIWLPEHGEAYVGELGEGVTRNGVALQPLIRGARPRGAATVKRLLGRQSDALAGPVSGTWSCAGVDYAKIINGVVDFVVYKPPKPWDHVPGTLMLRELGGVARTTAGAEYTAATAGTDLIVAASEAAHAAALAIS